MIKPRFYLLATFSFMAACLFLNMANAADSQDVKPNIVILGTGGTIAGTSVSPDQESYSAGKVLASELIKSVPGIESYANIKCDQVCNIPSQDMNMPTLLKVANRLNELVKENDVDGIVITHGTDTMEETAYFLDLVIHTDKPIVVTGAMRPSNSISADGPMNLLNSVAVAASPKVKGMGVLIVFNDKIMTARGCTKFNTTNLDAFGCPNTGISGYVNYGKIRIYTKSVKLNTMNSPFNIEEIKSEDLPKVFILKYGQGMKISDVLDDLIKLGYKGIVIDGMGDGNVYKEDLALLEKAREEGIAVVISSRTGSGPVLIDSELNNTELKFNTADDLNAQKARILLMLILTKTNNYLEIQKYFNEC